MLADEPTGNLDSKTSMEIGEIFHRLNQEEGHTFVVVSHEQSLSEWAHSVVNTLDCQIAGITDGGIRLGGS